MLKNLIKSKSKTFFTFCFCFLLGIFVISIINKQFDFVYLYLTLFIAIAFLIIYWKNKKTRFIIFCILFFTLGISRYLISFPGDSTKNISHYNGNKKTVIGYISSEPDVRSDGVRYILKIREDNLRGKIYFKSTLYPRYSYGDKLEIKCSLEKPENIVGDDGQVFRYDMYLARYGVYSLCQNPKIKKIGNKEGNKILLSIFSVKQVVADRINKLWHEPHASFMAGLLYGYRGGLGSLNELFSRTGVTHIVAISGYNITIIATILITLCIHLYIPRKKAFWVITIGIIIFVLFAGASASVVRAGIMGIIVLLAKQVGRTSKVGNVMILTCVVMCLQNPFVLIWDAGFQLSFISTLGLVYLNPIIEKPFRKMPEFFGMKESLVTTFSAIIATLPLILYQFGRLSIVAPVVNILILWILPAIMLLGFMAVVISFLFYPIANLIAWLAWIGLSYIIVVVKWFASLSFAAVDLKIPVWGMIGLYGFLIWVVFKQKK
jgi:competence protein ComEC